MIPLYIAGYFLYRPDGIVKAKRLNSMDVTIKERPATSRDKILKAAAELSKEIGPGHLSLDAVAARAGLSKGGLLYNFPTKKKLLEALVENHVQKFDAVLRKLEEGHAGCGNALALAYLELFPLIEGSEPPPSGVLAAIAEDFSFIDPIRRYRRELLDRMWNSSADRSASLVTFLAVEGMRAMRLFDTDNLTAEERQMIFQRLRELLGGRAPPQA